MPLVPAPNAPTWYGTLIGYDLDSDGGFVVTPDDLYHSDLLELVQIYGIPPNY